jgi:hypothetical protein
MQKKEKKGFLASSKQRLYAAGVKAQNLRASRFRLGMC